MHIAYCDCFSGVSGDMLLGALLDAGLSLDALRGELDSLGLADAFELGAEHTMRGPLRATKAHVRLKQASQEHAHARHLSDIVALIEASRLSQSAKDKSRAIFTRLAEAEAGVHGTSVEEVHFHEVGAVDAIVDIVGTVVGLEALGIEALYASPLPLGGGQVETRHGTLPLPAPATLALLAQVGAPIRPWPGDVELVTPTGAAILTTLAKFEQPAMYLEQVGIGAGSDDFAWPNVMRLWLGRASEETLQDTVVMETNIDDMNPEFYGHVMDGLFTAGALDVYMTPIYMKKNRPATMLSVIARREHEAALAKLLLRETSTLGVRVLSTYRYEAGRETRAVQTPFGEVPIKLKSLNGQVVSASPEYDACSRLASEHGVPVAEVYQAAVRAGAVLLEVIGG
jgi:uncharacterized protein (TIGR00299 family) protein